MKPAHALIISQISLVWKHLWYCKYTTQQNVSDIFFHPESRTSTGEALRNISFLVKSLIECFCGRERTILSHPICRLMKGLSEKNRPLCSALKVESVSEVNTLAPLWRPFLTKTSCCLFPSSWPGGSIREFPCSSEGRCGACCSTFPKSRRRRKTSTRYWALPHQFTSLQHRPHKDSSQHTPWFYLISVSSRISVGTMLVWRLNCVLCVSAHRKVSFCSAERQTLDLIRKFSCQDQYIAAFSGCGEVF